LVPALLLSGCATIEDETGRLARVFRPYRIDVVHGNVVTREQIDRVKPGMTRTQVRDILGSPMLTDIFHANRWDYVFTIVRPDTPVQRRSVVALFDGETLKSIEAPELPTEREFVASITRDNVVEQPHPLELTAEQLKALPAPPPREPALATESAPLRDYPPLEPAK
jgi:outer membrane protein assembly factor BamE